MNISAQIDPKSRADDGLAEIRLHSKDFEELALDLPFADVVRAFGKPATISLDLLLVAGVCYVVDKTVPRDETGDAWTREFDVSFPVSDRARWTSVAAKLNAALTFLTGDVWRTTFRPLKDDLYVAPRRRRKRSRNPQEPMSFDAVCLLSGGLDSAIGAIDYLEDHPKHRVMLVGHYDFPGPMSQQDAVHGLLQSRFPGRTKLVQVRVSQKPAENAEMSLRSRSIVFLALGIYAALELGGDPPVLAPENGLIALNIPLTPSRIGSCSTRTMHPFFLNTMRSVFQELKIKSPLSNPLELKTKGECVTHCKNAALLKAVMPHTVSCSHAGRRKDWNRKTAKNCGYCMPCLFRRAALHAANLDSGGEYGVDVCSDELTIESDRISANDLRAVTGGLRHFNTEASIRKAVSVVASMEPMKDYVALVQRGFDELRSWIRDQGSPSLQIAAGIKRS